MIMPEAGNEVLNSVVGTRLVFKTVYLNIFFKLTSSQVFGMDGSESLDVSR